MKYYYKAINGVIQYMAMSKTVPNSCTEISEEDYNRFVSIIRGIERREGYESILTLRTDFTYEVVYVEIIEEEGGTE